MKSKIDWVRRGQRVIRMVSELHRLGYQRLRLMPYKHPNAWRLAVGPRDIFAERNGAYIPHNSLNGLPIYTATGGGNAYFDWQDAMADDARTLAEKFVSRFPDVAKRGWGRDWAYAGWLAELVGFLEGGDWLPVTYWEHMKGAPEQLGFLPIWDASGTNIDWEGLKTIPGPGVREFPLPPCELVLQSESDYASQAVNSTPDITLLSLAGEGGELDLVLRMAEGGIYSYRLLSGSCESVMFEDEDFSDSEYVRHSDGTDGPLVIDWPGALRLLNDRGWPWPMLTPIYVHPSISANLISALKNSYVRYPEINFQQWDECIWKASK